MENKFIIQKIKKLNFFSTEDSIRYELYSIITSLILSKEFFKKNKDANTFLENLGIENKSYIIKNRTSMLAKALRIINKKDINELKKFQNELLDICEKYNIYKEKESGENYIKSMLEKYSRDDLDE
ncbi:hypothetical protein [Clostridium tetani]|uniref:hypothetical protein n=1 Tax=Clostridium tetani TaxID=1513 RepID=UPI0003C0CC92|nr:hypothetical protein [Clostridium tetani]CDI49204.1 hypothetical protein BN906_01197 [Clostridium tetani 12124569]